MLQSQPQLLHLLLCQPFTNTAIFVNLSKEPPSLLLIYFWHSFSQPSCFCLHCIPHIPFLFAISSLVALLKTIASKIRAYFHLLSLLLLSFDPLLIYLLFYLGFSFAKNSNYVIPYVQFTTDSLFPMEKNQTSQIDSQDPLESGALIYLFRFPTNHTTYLNKGYSFIFLFFLALFLLQGMHLFLLH